MCPAPNKVRGNNLERLVVARFVEAGRPAKRAWGSNGKSLGQHEEVDVMVYETEVDLMTGREVHAEDLKIQCKSRKKIPQFLGLTEHVDATVFKEKAGTMYIMFRLDDFIERYI
jgi:hypothetical protein